MSPIHLLLNEMPANRTRGRFNRRLTAVDAGLWTRYWSFWRWAWDCVGVVSGCTTGLFLGNEFWPSLLCNFVTPNKSSDSVTETIPQCNSTQYRPTLMVDLKMARFCFTSLYSKFGKRTGPILDFLGALLRIFSWPLPGHGPVSRKFRQLFEPENKYSNQNLKNKSAGTSQQTSPVCFVNW